ncbi:hypothetical protein HPB51_015417 [Rhipicephalus microplus]|uniref:Uncharacterized protein n=1 Tax=Rhipicephalus microplus TaxID=6941 RepID=A0A9J6DVH4_RHIMP|nr:hypothetical protein HPB51_015417 [Rhipicephalus microplus]
MDAMGRPMLRGAALALVLLCGAFVMTDALRREEGLGEGSWLRNNPISSSLMAEDAVHRWTTDSESFGKAFLQSSGEGDNNYNSQNSDVIAPPPTVTVDHGESFSTLETSTSPEHNDFSGSTESQLASPDFTPSDSWYLSRTSIEYPGPSLVSYETTADTYSPEPEFMTPSFYGDTVNTFSLSSNSLTSPSSIFTEEKVSDEAVLMTSSFPVDSTRALTPAPDLTTSFSPSLLTPLPSSSYIHLLDEPFSETESVSSLYIGDVSVVSDTYSENESKSAFSTDSSMQQTLFPTTVEISVSTGILINASAPNDTVVDSYRHVVTSVERDIVTVPPVIESSKRSPQLTPTPTSTSPLFSSSLTSSPLLKPETLLPITTELLPIEKTFNVGAASHSLSAARTEMLPTENTETSYLSGPSPLWTSEKGRDRTPLGSWRSSAESNRPTLLWFTTSPPATRKTDWFLTSVSRWFVPPSTILPDWSRSPPDAIVRPTSVFTSFGNLDNESEPSLEALNHQMKYWIRTGMLHCADSELLIESF